MLNPRTSVWLTVVLLGMSAPVWAEAARPLPPSIATNPAMKDLRHRMLEGTRLSDADMRALADLGEGLAAARYAQRLEGKGDRSLLGDIAHYYSIAVYGDRDFAVPRLVRVLDQDGIQLSESRRRNIRDVLEGQAQSGNRVAASGLAKLYLRGSPFGLDVPRARELLLASANAGDDEAAFRLAVSYLQGAPGFPPDPQAARPALALAIASPNPGVQAMAQTLALRLSDGTPVLSALAPTDGTLRPSARPIPITSPRPRPRPATLMVASSEGASP